MAEYGCDPLKLRSVNDLSNTILLRADLRRTFDALKWVIIPKPNSENIMQFVFHLIQDSPELAKRYHNSCVHKIAGVSPQLLFAAFSRAIFSLVREFLTIGVGRWLLATSSQSQTHESRYYTGLECKAKEACGLKGASSGDFIYFQCPHNSSSNEGHTSMNAIGDRISVLVNFPLALMGRIRQTKRYHLFRHIVGRLTAATELEKNTGEG